MTESSIGIVLANLFIFVVAMTYALVARWRGLIWRPQYGTAVYLILLAPSLVLFRGIDGDRLVALWTILTSVIGLALLLGGRAGNRRP
jgi:hypothetical protein